MALCGSLPYRQLRNAISHLFHVGSAADLFSENRLLTFVFDVNIPADYMNDNILMGYNNTECNSGQDLVTSRTAATLLWGVPTCVILAGFVLSSPLNQILWVLSYAVMGLGCVANTRACHRVHCHFTAPWFLLIAIVLALGLISVQALAPGVLAAAGLVGFAVIWVATEQIWGRYWDAQKAE